MAFAYTRVVWESRIWSGVTAILLLVALNADISNSHDQRNIIKIK